MPPQKKRRYGKSDLHGHQRPNRVDIANTVLFISRPNPLLVTDSVATVYSTKSVAVLFVISKAHANQMRNVVGSHLVVNASTVSFHCFCAHTKFLSDLSAGETINNMIQNLTLTSGQTINTVFGIFEFFFQYFWTSPN